MKYIISRQAMTHSVEMEEIAPTSELDGIKACEDSMDKYLDTDLYDKGIVGGEIWIRVVQGECFLDNVFWAPGSLNSTDLGRLVENVEGQLSDGIGENGFEHIIHGRKVIVQSVLQQESLVKIVDDDRFVLEPPLLATAAGNGDTDAVRTLIQSHRLDLERRYQFWTPLQRAIQSGAEEVVELLLTAGADASSATEGWDPHTTLELCAISNAMSDEQSARIASMLIARGANVNHVTSTGETALSYAEIRGKPQLAQVLK